MRQHNTLFIRLAIAVTAVVLSACGVKKQAVAVQPKEEQPTWHTCLMQGAHATVKAGDDRYSASVTMQTVRDSMIIISVMPVLSMEMARLEATPGQLIAIDKIHSRYLVTTFDELNLAITPDMSWKTLQQIASGELPTGSEKARLVYTAADKTVEIEITYPARKTDVPVKMNRLRTDRYTKIDISKF